MLTRVPPPAGEVMSTRWATRPTSGSPRPEAGAVVPRGHAGAVVGHRQHQLPAAVARLERDLAGRALAVGVDDAVGDDLGHGEEHVGQGPRIGSVGAQEVLHCLARDSRGAWVRRERALKAGCVLAQAR